LRAALVVVLCVTVGNVAPAFGAIGALLPSDVAVEVDYTVGGEGSSGVTFRLKADGTTLVAPTLEIDRDLGVQGDLDLDWHPAYMGARNVDTTALWVGVLVGALVVLLVVLLVAAGD